MKITRMGKVAVFGSYVADLMARAPHLPTAGETVKGSMFKMGPGGKGFNQGVAAHKAGADVTVITKIGADAFADLALHTMNELGMRQDYVFVDPTVPTGCALIAVDEASSQNEIVIVSGACDTISADETERLAPVIQECEYVLLQLEVNQDANARVAALARQFGCKVILNPAPYSPLSTEFLSACFMVTPNEVEAECLTGIPIRSGADAQQAAKYFHDIGIPNVIITLGGRGVYLSENGKGELFPAFRVAAIDTTGAGDAFNGGLLAALSEGKPLRSAVRFANAVGALSVQRIGTTPAMPTRAEIDAFLRQQE